MRLTWHGGTIAANRAAGQGPAAWAFRRYSGARPFRSLQTHITYPDSE